MSSQQDFERIWKSVELIIYDALLSGKIENIFDTLNTAWALEQKKWREPTRVHNNFLLALSKKNFACFKQFHEATENFSFQKVALPASPSLVPYFFGVFSFVVLGICAGYFLPPDSFLPNLIGRLPTIIFGGIFFAGMGNGIFEGLRRIKLKAWRKTSANLYMEQLNSLRQVLLELCKKADAS